MAVCVLPGTELAFSNEVTFSEPRFVVGWKSETLKYATAIFRQVNKNVQWTHHDALECPDGRIVLLTHLCSGQEATYFSCLRSQPLWRKQKPETPCPRGLIPRGRTVVATNYANLPARK